ncbi:hypothetical protein GCM10023093_14450 [Nemorincola caseinilytica]|uniref:Outer membrane protein beta-barrel domain-containing protein n=1 Tax=Nemorincola caseinilytica TaxID=2054315 RepID=A0ABP8NAZ9_9BACT
MKHRILIALLCCVCISASGQGGMYGAQAGMGYTPGYASRLTPAVEAYYLHKVMYHFYAGGSLFFQRYSFKTDVGSGAAHYGNVLSMEQRSSYIFLSPKVDYAINYRSYFHVFATFGLGVRVGGRELSYTHSPIWTTPGGTPYGADTLAVNTSYNLPGTKARFGFGLAERIPTLRFWNIMLSQEVGFMPGSLSKGPYALSTPYVCFQVGIMHKYPQVFVEY